jgi:hypothetical protein
MGLWRIDHVGGEKKGAWAFVFTSQKAAVVYTDCTLGLLYLNHILCMRCGTCTCINHHIHIYICIFHRYQSSVDCDATQINQSIDRSRRRSAINRSLSFPSPNSYSSLLSLALFGPSSPLLSSPLPFLFALQLGWLSAQQFQRGKGIDLNCEKCKSNFSRLYILPYSYSYSPSPSLLLLLLLLLSFVGSPGKE